MLLLRAVEISYLTIRVFLKSAPVRVNIKALCRILIRLPSRNE